MGSDMTNHRPLSCGPLPCDAHIHLGFAANAEEVADAAAEEGLELFSCTVTPQEYLETRERFESFGNVHVGVGLHPWWIEAQRTDGGGAEVAKLVSQSRFVGEIGLDFGKRHVETRTAQVRAFEAICEACAEVGGRVLSIHSVHAAKDALDILERTGALEGCTCIFHWFSGPSDQLKRAIEAGCLFSVGPRMTAAGKGREYVKAIPANRLLLETDEPANPGDSIDFADLRAKLSEAASFIAQLKGETALTAIAETSQTLFGPQQHR